MTTESEAQIDRLQQELTRMQQDLAAVRRAGLAHEGASKAPSHVTRAQAARILGTSTNGVIYKMRVGKLTAEQWWGTTMITMASIVKALDEKADA